MKRSKEIVYLNFPNRIAVCESLWGLGVNPVTNDCYCYAQIVRYNEPVNWQGTQYELIGDIEWEEDAKMLTPEHRAEILRFAANLKLKNLVEIAEAVKIRNRNRWLEQLQKKHC